MAEELYLNNVQVELSDRAVALTSQVNELAELADRQADYSNNIKLPKTPTNIATMEMLGLAGNQSTIPYINVEVKYVIDGIEQISGGKGVLKNTNNYYNLVIYSGNISITDLLGNLKLNELDFSAYNHNLTQANFFSSFANTSGYIYGLGKFYENDDISIVDINLQSPSFYIHTLMDMIFTQQNYTISGGMLTNTDYLSRVTSMDIGYDRISIGENELPYTVDTHPSFIEDFVVQTIKSYIIHSYTAVEDGALDINSIGKVNISFGQNAYLVLVINGIIILEVAISDGGTFDNTFTAQVEAGDIIDVKVGLQSEERLSGVHKITIFNEFTTIFSLDAITLPIAFEDLIGETKQIDFVKAIMQHFGAVVRKTRNSDNYEFKLMEILLADKSNAEDWSDKYVGVPNESYKAPYAQTNILKYKYDEATDSDTPEIFADGEFYIADVNLPIEKTVFTSIFKASELASGTNPNNYYTLNQWLLNSDDEIEPVSDGLRMFQINNVVGSIDFRLTPDILSYSTFTGTIPYLNFENLGYTNELEYYYKGIYSMLNNYRKITVDVNLSVIDNYQLDFFKLKYFKQLGQYYYLNKVKSFKKDKITKVELIEVNDYTPLVVPDELMVAKLVTGTTVTANLTQATIISSLAVEMVADTVLTAQLSVDYIYEEHRNFYNGTFLESFDALVTENAGVVTMTLTNADGVNDLTMVFSDGYTVLSTPVTIELTVGSDSSPQTNWITIPKSSKVLTKSTSAWETAEHIKIGFFFVQSAADITVDGGSFINQNWNEHTGLTYTNQGHESHMGAKLRSLGSTYFSGIDPNGTSGYLTITSGNVEFKSTSGIVFQMHPQTFPLFDTSISSVMHVKNWSGDAYHSLTNLYDIVADSTGSTIGTNKWFNLIFWGVQNKEGEAQTILVNLSDGFYNTQSDAENDVSGHDDFTIPREFNIDSSTGFLIVKITVKKTPTTWVYGSAINLRGTTPQTAAGGASGAITGFADNQFHVFNVTDNTKVVELDVSNITTETTRTLTIQDDDGTIALIETHGLQEVTDANATTNNNITVPSMSLDTGAGVSVSQGQIAWNADEETFDFGLNGSILQGGQEVHYHVHNNSGSNIANGKAVMATGTLGASGRITIGLMDGSDIMNAKYFLGITTEDIANGEDGKVTFFGKVRDLNTDSWNEGDVLWIDNDNVGELTNVQPTTKTKLPIAFVVYKHNSVGTLAVRSTDGTYFSESHDVDISSIANNDRIIWDGTKFVNRSLNVVEDTTPQAGGEFDLQAHSLGGTVQTATGDGTTTIDWRLGNMFDFQFGAFNETFTFTAPTKAGTFILKLVQDSVGSRTATWAGTVKWVEGTSPTLTTTGTTGTDIITFYYNGTSYFAVQSLNFS